MMVPDTASIGQQVRAARKAQQLTQPDLALIANVGVRFIVDLENGKETCQLGLALGVMRALGMHLEIHPPSHDMDTSQEPTTEFDASGGFQP
jgi:HTH-type transcriptional regulator/antitoxin HipB